MKSLIAVLLAAGLAQPPAKETQTPPGVNPPPKKETGEGNSDLQKLTPAGLNDLSRRIETALIGDTGTGTLGLKIGVEDQMIVISGDAPDEEARKRASEIATRIADNELYRIVNKVRIKPAGTETGSRKAGVTDAPTAPDLAQVERIDAVLREKLPDLASTIRARFRVDPMPSILLEGVVDTMEQKVEVSRVIRSEVKSLPLLNNIQLRIKPNVPMPRPAADAKQPRQMGGAQNKAVALDSETREDEIPVASALANKIMGDSRIWDTVVLIQMDGGLCWLKGTVETFAHKVRVVNHAERMRDQGVTYVIDDLTVATALRGAAELSTAKNSQAAVVAGDSALIEQDAVIYFKRYLRDSVPIVGGYEVTPGDAGTIKVVLKGGVRTPEEMKRISDAVQKMSADLGVKAVVEVRPAGAAVTPVPPPAP